MNKNNKSTELDNTDKKLHISDVRRMLIDFGIWLDKNDRKIENVNDFLKSINYA